MDQILLTLGGLTLGGSAAVLLLAWAGKSTRGRYGARWRCWAWLLLCLRLAVPLPLVLRGEARAPIQMDVPNPPAAVQQPVTPAPGNTPAPTLPAGPQGGQDKPSGSESGSPSPAPATPAPDKTETTQPLDLTLVLIGVWLAGAV